MRVHDVTQYSKRCGVVELSSNTKHQTAQQHNAHARTLIDAGRNDFVNRIAILHCAIISQSYQILSSRTILRWSCACTAIFSHTSLHPVAYKVIYVGSTLGYNLEKDRYPSSILASFQKTILYWSYCFLWKLHCKLTSMTNKKKKRNREGKKRQTQTQTQTQRQRQRHTDREEGKEREVPKISAFVICLLWILCCT